MAGLWRNNEKTKGGKYLVQRRDGTVPEWPHIVLGARDPAAAAALRCYAAEADALGYDPEYVADIKALADEFDAYREHHGPGNPTSCPERPDDPEVVDQMIPGRSA